MTKSNTSLSRTARFCVVGGVLAGSLFAYSAALAQSTGSQATELVVTGKRDARATAGLAVQVQDARDESIVTQAFIKTQVGSDNFAQLINFLPGVTYSGEDFTGLTSGDLRIHGLDGAHLGVTLDGNPVNDTGNYAIYPGEYLPAELTSKITVNIGANTVDTPSASSLGGSVDIVSKIPSATPERIADVSGGSYDYIRGYGEIDSGAVGPTGLRSYLAVDYAHARWWTGVGDLLREGANARLYQPLSGKGFLSVAATYVYEDNVFNYDASPSQIAANGGPSNYANFAYNPSWKVPTAINGTADGIANNGGLAGNDSTYYKLHQNPVQFGQVRGSSLFDLGHGLTFTFDPTFFYTLANGGGTTSLSECDPRLKGNTTTCVDLNGDGDTKDTVLVYSPSNTQTHRFTLNTSLLWDLNEQNHFQLAYTYDYGHHRQTGQMTTINQQTGEPNNIFGAETGYGTPILSADGVLLRTRDRLSIAKLSQFSINYVGKFFDDRLHVNLGVRDPNFSRDLNQYCYTYNGSSAYCTSESAAVIQAAYNAALATASTTKSTAALTPYIPGVKWDPVTNAPNLRAPFKQNFNFEKVLPNAGASFRFDETSSVYITYAAGFSAPKTDDLYTSTTELVHPETTDEYGVGYRFQSPHVTLSANLWDTEYHNRIVSSVDPLDPTSSIDRNVGNVRIYGLDLEGGWKATEHLSLYASGTLQNSRLESNYLVASSTGVSEALPVKGKQLVLTPNDMFALRAQYEIDDLTFGMDTKYEGRRYISDTNDATIGGNMVVDLDAKYVLPTLNRTTSIQLNVVNLMGETYYSRASTVSTTQAVAATPNYSPGTPYLYLGQPRAVVVTLKAKF